MVKSMGKCSMCRKELRWNQFDKLTTNLAGMIESYQVCYDEHGNKKDQVGPRWGGPFVEFFFDFSPSFINSLCLFELLPRI